MRINIDKSLAERALFITAANQPTQVAYGLTDSDVTNAFVVSLLAAGRTFLAASYYFESDATRNLTKRFPRVFSLANPDCSAIFFINSEYPTFLDHGLRKAEKSPSSFSAYSNIKLVQARGRFLDGIGLVGVRENIDVSDALAKAWKASCHSDEENSIKWLLQNRISPSKILQATIECMALADRGKYDFIWPAIAPEIEKSSFLRPLSADLRRKLADLYAEVMSITLRAIETTPCTRTEGLRITSRSMGHLGIFDQILQVIGIDSRAFENDERLLLMVGASTELNRIREIHRSTLKIAAATQGDAVKYWRAIELAERHRRAPGVRISDAQMKKALTDSFGAMGITPNGKYKRNILKIEGAFDNRFLNHFRCMVEQMAIAPTREARQVMVYSPPKSNKTLMQDTLLFVGADPEGELELNHELMAVRHALDGLGDACQISMESVLAFGIGDLQTKILSSQPKYFHFSGHGTDRGEIVAEGEKGAEYIKIEYVVQAISLLRDDIECVVFSSCFSEKAIRKIEGNIKYVILMSDEIDDEVAINFADSFYQALGAGIPVPKAFLIGCNNIDLHNLPQSDVPRLYCRGKIVKQTG